MINKFLNAAPLNRTGSIKHSPKPKIIIVCEGKVTEPRYFKDFKHLHRNSLVTIETIGGCGVPVSVVERAIEERKSLKLQAKRSQDSFDLQYEVWAVFDRDTHPDNQVPRALELARSNRIGVAYSNPCFEVWGLMHYSCYSRPGRQDVAQNDLKRAMPSYCHKANPVFDVSALNNLYLHALSNAQRALRSREEEGKPGADPSTTVFQLTERIRNFGRRAEIADKSA